MKIEGEDMRKWQGFGVRSFTLKTKIIIGVVSILLFVGIIWAFIYFNTSYKTSHAVPTLTLKGEDNIRVNWKDAFTDPGATATIQGKNADDRIIIEGTVDTNTIGTYTIIYKIMNDEGKNEVVKKRTVQVVDLENPTLILKGDTIMQVYVDTTYREPGYEAKDNHDGDLTDKVTVTNSLDTKKVGSYEIIYAVTDSSGNSTELKRTVQVIERPRVDADTNGIAVLLYHNFYDAGAGESGKDNSWIEISQFEQQIKYLKGQNYYLAKWDEINQYLDGEKVFPTKTVVITIDDANESFFRLAYPVLKQYEMKATAFVVTSWNKANTLQKYTDFINFESHSHNMHQKSCDGQQNGAILCIQEKEALEDLAKSKTALGRSNAFAYPFGNYDDRAMRLVKNAGFSMAFTEEQGKIKPYMEKFQLPRIKILDTTSFSEFQQILK